MDRNKEKSYKGFPISDLILFSIHSVILKNEQCSFDRLVKECFILFPDSIKFSRYPIWPDSRKLDRPLRALRKERLIIGDPKSYFALTDMGVKKAVLVD